MALISTGCTSGLDAIAHGVQLIEEGAADIVLAGATDAPLSPITSACFDAIKATTPNADQDPGSASRPFDGRRDGFVLGEGSAVMVIEEAGAARRRGATVYAEVAGFANRSNAFHMTGLKPDGREMAEAIRVALDRARLDRARSTTSTRTAPAPSRTTGTRRPPSSGPWGSAPTRSRSAPSSR